MMKRLRLSFTDPIMGQQIQKITLLRNEIDAIDNNIIALLGKRMEYVREIGVWKRDQNISLLQLERWKHILFTRMRKSKEMNLSREFVRAIFEQIHEEALRIQEEIKAPTTKDR
jgi:chorismate mutase